MGDLARLEAKGSVRLIEISDMRPARKEYAVFWCDCGQWQLAPRQLRWHEVFAGIQCLFPGNGFAGVCRHAPHDRGERTLRNILELVERLASTDSLDQVRALLQVRILFLTFELPTVRPIDPIQTAVSQIRRAFGPYQCFRHTVLAARDLTGHAQNVHSVVEFIIDGKVIKD